MQWGITFTEKCYYGVRFNVVSVTRIGEQFSGKNVTQHLSVHYDQKAFGRMYIDHIYI